MDTVEVIDNVHWHFGKLIGYHHSFFTFNIPTILNTWVVLITLFAISSFVRSILFRHKKPPLAYHTLIIVGEFFKDLCTQTLGYFSFTHSVFTAALFIFILLCNIISIVGLEEPTIDLNTTLALGIITFLYAQMVGLYHHGIIGYLKGFFEPFFFLLPLNIIGKLTSIISISFRLFGNIFGGSIVAGIYLSAISSSMFTEIVGLFSGANLIPTLFFVIFEGLVQAFIFAVLTLTYLSMAIQSEGGH